MSPDLRFRYSIRWYYIIFYRVNQCPNRRIFCEKTAAYVRKRNKKGCAADLCAFIIYFYHRKRLMLLFVEKSDIITVRKGVF